MSESTLQNLSAADVAPDTPLGAAVFALNNAHAKKLSWLPPERLQYLAACAFAARRIGELDAFLLAFDQDAPYDSPNFLWFRERYPRFVYVDRVVVAAAARRDGLARRSTPTCSTTLVAGHDRVVCEVNSRPPGPESDALHAALGFAEVGRASVHNGSKDVRYLSRML